MKPTVPETPGQSQVLLYQTEDQQTRLEVCLVGETVWLSLNQMAELFQRDKSVISRHIRNVFDEGELLRERVVAKFATTAADGKTYQVEYFNLDVIISERADASKPHMGLTSCTGRKPRKSDVTIAKNYLNHEELETLNRIVTAYLEFAELQAKSRKPMYMNDWIAKA